jgi:predicted nicotinamide N-methyase
MEGEADLHQRFQLRVETFHHGGFHLSVLLPAASDALIDEAEFDADERLPYWAELWPSARALASQLLDAPPARGPVLELGSGVGLPSLALRHAGLDVLVTDWYPDALLFAGANARRNGLGSLDTRLPDWREPPLDLGTFPLVIAADVLYEARNVEPLAHMLERAVGSGGSAIVADPGRVYFPHFLKRLASRGWTAEELPPRSEPSPAGNGRRVNVRLVRLHPPNSPTAQRKL